MRVTKKLHEMGPSVWLDNTGGSRNTSGHRIGQEDD